MSLEFAEAANLVNITRDLSEIEDYMVRALLLRNRQLADSASTSSTQGRNRLSQFISDKFGINGDTPQGLKLGVRYMSENLKNQTPWGMLPNNL